MEEQNTCRVSAFPSDRESADVILRSVDQVDVHVHKVILSHSSTFFRTMFSLPQPPSELMKAIRSPSFVEVSETAKTLETLLRICYPFVKEKSRPFEDIEPALTAALKYDMPLPIDVLTNELLAAIPQIPLRAWAVACRAGLEPVARSAGEYLLEHSSSSVQEELEYMSGVSAANYYRLRQFQRLKGKAAPTFSLLSPSLAPALPAADAMAEGSQEAPYCHAIPYADLLCLSADGVELLTHRCVLAMASPVVASKLAAEDVFSNRDTAQTTHPRISFEECGQVLVRLLDTCCYLREDRVPTTTSEIAVLIAVAEKYQMSRGLEILRAHWDRAAENHPLDAYFTAVKAGWVGHARRVATLLLAVDSLDTIYDSSMEIASIGTYHRLLTYYDECREAAEREITTFADEWKSLQDGVKQTANLLRSSSQLLDVMRTLNQASSIMAVPAADVTNNFPPKVAHGEDPQWSLYSFMNMLGSLHGPYEKVSATRDIVTVYLKWRRHKDTLSYASREEASMVLQFAEALPKRLQDAIERVVLQID